MRKSIAVLVAALAMVSCSSSDDNHDNHDDGDTASGDCTATTSVTIEEFAFSPKCIIVTSGQTITFTNHDSAAHTATTLSGQSQTFDSGSLSLNESFTTPAITGTGTINGRCSFHTNMTFSIQVQ